MYENFKKCIVELGTTLYRVVKDIEVAYATLSNWKLGKTTPKVATLKKAAPYLNMSLEELIWEGGE
ncbi:hypothetical protein GCM10023142_11110 [Anaerocolumna aminovalerica]|uniref:Helix-turn-helix domain-containing protein n=1 Tax=Anaerocolumna aminovalerica TaxID=1527 RepID=A0A1I5IXV1_9FIRM|nr:helix-turn-helix transcriptional regulator [Anaerocolumna aminovalerica]SFO65385.1 Helix-turn-helix domain-containing protein [Anaerocolumna aminovalerica]